MSAEPVNQPNAVERFVKIPIVADTLNSALSLVKSYSFTAALYAQTERLAYRIFQTSKGVLPLNTANSYANKSLDYVQTRYPKAFEVHSDEIVKQARKPADAAAEIFNARLNAAQSSLGTAQEQLAAQIAKVPRTPEEAQKAINEILSSVYFTSDKLQVLSEDLNRRSSELHKLKDHATVQIQDLPANVEKVVSPLIESLNTGIHDITTELRNNDVPITTRATNVLKYSRENTYPVISEALNNLKGLIVKKADQASEKANEVQESGETYADKLKQDAIGPH